MHAPETDFFSFVQSCCILWCFVLITTFQPKAIIFVVLLLGDILLCTVLFVCYDRDLCSRIGTVVFSEIK